MLVWIGRWSAALTATRTKTQQKTKLPKRRRATLQNKNRTATTFAFLVTRKKWLTQLNNLIGRIDHIKMVLSNDDRMSRLQEPTKTLD